MPDFEEAGIEVYALSYDEPDALRDFQEAHGITYTLLSDPDSAVIRAFGILNTLIAEDDHPWFGIPYPGTYIVDADGIITNKFFDNNLAVRAGPEQLLRACLGESQVTTPAGAHAQEVLEEVSVNIRLDAEHLASTVQKDLVATFYVPASKHVYAHPAPEGCIAANIVLDDNASLVQRAIARPAGEPHRLVGTDEEFDVYHGEFELRLPLTVNSADRGGSNEVTIAGEVCWQSCDDEVCDIPQRQRFEITVPVTKSPAVALGSKEGAALEPNAMAHFQRMTTRRQ